MVRKTFERELQRLQNEMLSMAGMVENAITDSVEILKRRDVEGSQCLIAQDRAINKKRYEIEADCLVNIATQQPMPSDLRTLAAILNITTELERMGDYAKGIARINLMIGEQHLIKPLIDLPAMARKAREMLHAALVAFVERDVEAARSIPKDDDEVDALYNQVYRELICFILEDPQVIEQANHLMWAAHNLERTADRVINLCERVVYAVTGELTELGADDTGIESLG
jgi:phosphate transport system protein